MCGITGMYRFTKGSLEKEYFNWCVKDMKRRGPDAQQTWSNDKNYITGFTRLSIRDTSHAADQPMLTDCGNYCISFNGEIYNTNHLKQLLLVYRNHYRTTSDTEVLLYALKHLGIQKTLEAADGIFAFAFYDALTDSLMLARDRMGIKPLYIGVSNEGVVYSSHYNHIINHSFFSKENLNASAISAYLYLGYMPEHNGIINNTMLFPHGYYAVANDAGFSMFEYFSYGAADTQQKNISLDEVLENSVASQLVSDVPVGTFMSGGTDSTLVSYFAHKHAKLQSFTMGISSSSMDETETAKAYAKIFGIENISRQISSADLLKLIHDNTAAFSEPFADYSSIPVLALSAMTREKVTVALSGDGADELFWGYPRNIKSLGFIPLYAHSKINRTAKLLIRKLKYRNAADLSRHLPHKNFTDYYYQSLSITGAAEYLPQIMNETFYDCFFKQKSDGLFSEMNYGVGNMMQLMRQMEMDIHLQRILLKVDRAAMYHSLEVRVPYLSNDMLEYSAGLLYSDCIAGKEGKMNLKKSLITKTNTQLVMQPKKGFTIPVDDWLRKEIRNDVEEKIMNMPTSLSVFFRQKKLQQLLQMHQNKKVNAGWLLWAVYTLVLWHQAHYNSYNKMKEPAVLV
ncbi:MAG TPA: asparagine synthase (glutamine-hydrolyzing) [Chitinophagaceae bacterium]|nr:asparagine synthase (glutamine-hydrolyzing) [Chitinophagaceae bacterium]